MRTSKDKIDEIIKLRVENRLSLGDIKNITNVSRTTIARILKNYPLTKEESKQRWKSKVKNKFQKTVDLSGQKFGRLLVLYRDYNVNKKRRESSWYCQCECGNYHTVVKSSLKNGNTKSCGCLGLETRTNINCKNPEDVNLNTIFCSYKNSAKTRKLIFSLSKEMFLKLIKSNCYYCGIEPFSHVKFHKNHQGEGRNIIYSYNGIDRKDNSLGYIENNCVSCCKFCNRAKRESSIEEFQNWINTVKKRIIETFIQTGGYENGKPIQECNRKSETNCSNPTNSKS